MVRKKGKLTQMKSFLIVFLLSVFLSPACCSQKIDRKKLDGLFDTLQNRRLISGSLAISKNGKTIYQKALGVSMLDSSNLFLKLQE